MGDRLLNARLLENVVPDAMAVVMGARVVQVELDVATVGE
jgi:hypothetical protein